MIKPYFLLSLVIFFINSFASDHGIYLHTVSNIKGEMDDVKSNLLKAFSSSDFNVVSAMDMYFWDAGKFAFMDHMQMPGMLDESIKRAFFGSEEE